MMRQSTVTGPINLGNTGEFTIKELANLILGMIPQSRSRLVQMDLPMDDPQQRKPDARLALQYLQWTANVSLPDGLKSTIQYFNELLRTAESPSVAEVITAS